MTEGGNIGDRRLELGRDAPAPFHHGLAFFGQLAAMAIDELDTKFALEASHVTGHVGLHRVERGRCGREAAVISYGDERLQLSKIHQLYR